MFPTALPSAVLNTATATGKPCSTVAAALPYGHTMMVARPDEVLAALQG